VTEKLIRDGIPKIAADNGDPLTVRTASPTELPILLRMKLAEEAVEVIDASPSGLLEELADVIEVVHALAALHGHTPADIEHARAEKAAARGRFAHGLVMQLPTV
jgi:predicted house-cleaning noncanonical NTP pyrophosphatase (MazG superfamily)